MTFQSTQLTLSIQNQITSVTSTLLPFSTQRLRSLVLKTIQYVCNHYEVEFETVQLTVRFVNEPEGHNLNLTYRQKDYATNILTFAYGIDELHNLSADLVLCWPIVKREAVEQYKSIYNHLSHLLVHGVLHAMGFDHLNDEEAQEMESLEIDILSQFHIPNPYVVV